MKKQSVYYIALICLGVLFATSIFLHSQIGVYISRHIKNYYSGHIISRRLNPNMPGTANMYDAEDYRAGALAACNEVKEYYGKDLCTEAGYWGILGPRITIEQVESGFNKFGI